ncbi:unnamed protein product [Ranitomeya imitator]|uniref:Sodium channel non-voltage-gated 1 alpha subunit n=1 Tax=Ranitomeya imitator TaxID=111125 RepID=A0ABN9LWJ0_9NEOB|nr:unnamed protein product [Ranitomeya imitator]
MLGNTEPNDSGILVTMSFNMESTEAEKSEEGWFDFYESFTDLFEFFCDNTTIHGTIRLNCSRRNKMKTGFWLVLFFCTFGMMYWQFGETFRQYWSYPTSLAILLQTRKNVFPSVTVCNLNPYRFGQVNEYLKQLDQMAEETLSTLYGYNASLHLHKDSDIVNLQDIMNNTDIKDNGSFHLDTRITLEQIKTEGGLGNATGRWQKVGFKLNQTPKMYDLSFEGPECHLKVSIDYNVVSRDSIIVFFILVISFDGPQRYLRDTIDCDSAGKDCYNRSFWSAVDAFHEWYKFHFMNIMSKIPLVLEIPDKLLRKFILTCDFNGVMCTSNYSHFHHPTYGSCITINGENMNDSQTLSTIKPGKMSGLTLTLKTDQNDNMPILSSAAGAKVMIHNPNQSPLAEHEGFDIWPGTETSISIRQDQITRLGSPYSECTSDGSNLNFELLYNSSYTQQTCLQSCFQHKMMETCGCGYYFYPLLPGVEYCDYNKHPGWGKARWNYV